MKMMLMQYLKSITFGQHLMINIVLRLVLIGYGEFQDSVSEVPYTDIDYKVVTDGARHMQDGGSPFERHTYRYTPILAILLLPNLLVHGCVGKLIFSLFDLLVGVLIKKILCDEFGAVFRQNATAILNRTKKQPRHPESIQIPMKYEQTAVYSALAWLYNPLTMVIATRGNGDCITSLFVLLSLYFLLRPADTDGQYFLAGIFHGIAIHIRLYPFAFSLAYYLYAAHCHKSSLISSILWPNRKQINLVLGTVISLVGLTGLFYHLYGYQFIYEAYIYHLVRTDTRHNFSLYFYMQYLSAGQTVSLVQKIIQFAPQLLILIMATLGFARNRKTLPFCIFVQSFVMVTYNPVVTSQYFIWFLSVLPLCLKNFGRINLRTAIAYAVLWTLTQAAWLLPAYLLEFKGWNMFAPIWMQGVLFFGANAFILQRLIQNFNVIADFRLKVL